MSQTEIVIEGMLQANGTLVLDEKPNLPPGRVRVVLRQEEATLVPADDPFWQRMQAIWAIPRSSCNDGGANTLAEVKRSRAEWDEHQQQLEHLQEGVES